MVGPVRLDVDLPGKGPKERIMGFCPGRPANERLDLDVEIYNDHAFAARKHTTTLDNADRYRINWRCVALFMGGRIIKRLYRRTTRVQWPRGIADFIQHVAPSNVWAMPAPEVRDVRLPH